MLKSSDMTRAMSEIGMKMFAKFKDRLLADELTLEDYQNMLIASYFDGIGFQCGTSLPHGMGYPLSPSQGCLSRTGVRDLSGGISAGISGSILGRTDHFELRI